MARQIRQSTARATWPEFWRIRLQKRFGLLDLRAERKSLREFGLSNRRRKAKLELRSVFKACGLRSPSPRRLTLNWLPSPPAMKASVARFLSGGEGLGMRGRSDGNTNRRGSMNRRSAARSRRDSVCSSSASHARTSLHRTYGKCFETDVAEVKGFVVNTPSRPTLSISVAWH